MEQFHFDPRTYPSMILAEVPSYVQLQDEAPAATAGIPVARALDLGAGTGETSRRVLAVHPTATLVALDGSQAMLDCARPHLPTRTFWSEGSRTRCRPVRSTW